MAETEAGSWNKSITQLLLPVLFVFAFVNANAQDSAKTNPLTFSGYLELYYSYDFGKPDNHERPSFVYSLNRHNEVNLNLGFVKASYNTAKLRGSLALMAGTYSQYNLKSEQGLLKNIFEASIGVKISKKHELWIDAGIMPSHIGFESAITKDCWVLTRSILADNSPYYETGVKLGYSSKNEKLYLAAMYLNGWQRIQRIPANQTPAFGTQLTYRPNRKITLNWSTYAGNEQPDSLKQWRYFNNFYAHCSFTQKFGLIAGFDIGVQQQSTGSNSYNTWYSPILIARYLPTDKIRIAARGEYYSDEKSVIIATETPNGFQTFGFSLNIDYLPTDNVMFRIEGRELSSKDKIFTLADKPDNRNYFITGLIALNF